MARRPQATRTAAPFGSVSAERARRMIAAATQTKVWIGIQSEEGRADKLARDEEGNVITPFDPEKLAHVAAIHEFGNLDNGGVIPQRSYLRSTADRERDKWMRAFAAAMRAYSLGDDTGFRRVLGVLGTRATAQVKATIRKRISPPLAPSTVKERRKGTRKGRREYIDVPLIDTGQLVESIRSAADSPLGELVLG